MSAIASVSASCAPTSSAASSTSSARSLSSPRGRGLRRPGCQAVGVLALEGDLTLAFHLRTRYSVLAGRRVDGGPVQDEEVAEGLQLGTGNHQCVRPNVREVASEAAGRSCSGYLAR